MLPANGQDNAPPGLQAKSILRRISDKCTTAKMIVLIEDPDIATKTKPKESIAEIMSKKINIKHKTKLPEYVIENNKLVPSITITPDGGKAAPGTEQVKSEKKIVPIQIQDQITVARTEKNTKTVPSKSPVKEEPMVGKVPEPSKAEAAKMAPSKSPGQEQVPVPKGAKVPTEHPKPELAKIAPSQSPFHEQAPVAKGAKIPTDQDHPKPEGAKMAPSKSPVQEQAPVPKWVKIPTDHEQPKLDGAKIVPSKSPVHEQAPVPNIKEGAKIPTEQLKAEGTKIVLNKIPVKEEPTLGKGAKIPGQEHMAPEGMKVPNKSPLTKDWKIFPNKSPMKEGKAPTATIEKNSDLNSGGLTMKFYNKAPATQELTKIQVNPKESKVGKNAAEQEKAKVVKTKTTKAEPQVGKSEPAASNKKLVEPPGCIVITRKVAGGKIEKLESKQPTKNTTTTPTNTTESDGSAFVDPAIQKYSKDKRKNSCKAKAPAKTTVGAKSTTAKGKMDRKAVSSPMQQSPKLIKLQPQRLSSPPALQKSSPATPKELKEDHLPKKSPNLVFQAGGHRRPSATPKEQKEENSPKMFPNRIFTPTGHKNPAPANPKEMKGDHSPKMFPRRISNSPGNSPNRKVNHAPKMTKAWSCPAAPETPSPKLHQPSANKGSSPAPASPANSPKAKNSNSPKMTKVTPPAFKTPSPGKITKAPSKTCTKDPNTKEQRVPKPSLVPSKTPEHKGTHGGADAKTMTIPETTRGLFPTIHDKDDLDADDDDSMEDLSSGATLLQAHTELFDSMNLNQLMLPPTKEVLKVPMKVGKPIHGVPMRSPRKKNTKKIRVKNPSVKRIKQTVQSSPTTSYSQSQEESLELDDSQQDSFEDTARNIEASYFRKLKPVARSLSCSTNAFPRQSKKSDSYDISVDIDSEGTLLQVHSEILEVSMKYLLPAKFPPAPGSKKKVKAKPKKEKSLVTIWRRDSKAKSGKRLVRQFKSSQKISSRKSSSSSLK